MIQIDRTKSLQELENKDIGEPNFDSHLVKECHRLNRVPLNDFTIEDLRIMIGQNISLNYLIPIAIEKLQQNPLAEGNFYAGDLLVNVLMASHNYWSQFPELKEQVAHIAGEAFEVPSLSKIECEAIRDAYTWFLRDSSPQH